MVSQWKNYGKGCSASTVLSKFLISLQGTPAVPELQSLSKEMKQPGFLKLEVHNFQLFGVVLE